MQESPPHKGKTTTLSQRHTLVSGTEVSVSALLFEGQVM